MAYDSADGYVVLFGGALSSGNGALGDTWKFSDGHWTQINTALAPTARVIQSVAYDSADRYVVLFGGLTLVGTQPKSLGDTWKFSNGSWSNITGTVGPSPRLAASMAYDGSAADKYVVMFGGLPAIPLPGASVGNALKDSWKFSGGTWTNITGASGPSARAGAMIAYDPADGYVLLYGGAVQSSVLSDTWRFSSGLWSSIAPSNAPGPRVLGSMAFDAATRDNYLIFFGGASTLSSNGLASPHSDTWKYSGGAWTNITATGPPVQFGSAIAYDGSSTDGYVLLLGVGGVSWRFSGGPWTFISTFWIPGPSSRVGASMAYDVVDGYVLLFGGSSNVSINGIIFHDTWKFQSGSWTNITTSNGPPAGNYESMAYDAADGYIVLLTNQDTTWRFGGGVWTLVSTPTSPGYKGGASMIYDAVDQYVVLFGGCCRPGSILPDGDTWTFHAGTWTNATSIGRPSPSARLYASMAYDSVDGYGVLFGGVSILPTSFPFAGSLRDTWTFANGSWKNVTMTNGPPPPSPRALATMVYDRAAGYVLLFGGVNGQTGFVGDTWRFSGETWNYIPTSVSPSARSNGSMTYDDADHYAVLFGGTSSATGLGDTWTWSVASSPWTPLEITGTRPSPRIFGSMTYDAADGYVILFGGVTDFTFSNSVQLHDTWKFQAGVWSNITSTSGVPCFQPCPLFGGYFQMAYDATDGYVVMPSGDSVGSTWVFRAGAWTNINLGCTKTTCPSFRYQSSVTYDAADQSVLLFGGMNGSSTPAQPLSDTWEFHAGVWTKVMTGTQPSPPRAHAAMAYDSADGYAILFGGDYQTSSSSFKMFGDTWKFAGGTWTNITTANGPAPRTVSTMTYDAADGYVLLVDGSNYMGNFGDNWKFSGGAWKNIPTDVSPLARSHSFIAYDGADGYVVLFGGGSYPVPLSDTWTWSVPASVFDYSLSNNGPVTIEPGGSGTVTLAATLTSGTSQQVTLSCVSASLPTGITCSGFTNNPLTPNASSDLTISVASSVGAGSYSLLVTGSPLGPTTSPTTVALTVTTPAPFARVGSLTLSSGQNDLYAAVIDTSNGYAYFAAETSPSIIVKIRLSDFTVVGSLTLNTGENTVPSAVIDPANGYAYFGTHTSPGIIVKVRLSDLTRVGALTLNPGENNLDSAAIDSSNGYAYFQTNTSPSSVVKIRLSDFTRVGALILDSSHGTTGYPALVDSAKGFGYFGAGSGFVVRVRLSDFTINNTLTIPIGHPFQSAAIDAANGYAYFGTYTSPGIVVKLRLSDFTYVGSLTLNTGENSLFSAAIDSANGFAYFGGSAFVKVRLSDFTRAGSLTLNPGDGGALSTVIDSASGFAYVGTSASPGIVVKIEIAAPAGSDFSISAIPSSVTIPQGYTVSIRLVFTSIRGFSGTINYVSPSPGPGLLQNPNTVALQANSDANLVVQESVPRSVPVGDYTLAITWSSGSLTHTASIPVKVVALGTTPGISLSVSPGSLNIPQGGSTTASVTLNSLNGFAGTVTLYNFFSRLSTSFTPTTVKLTSGQSVNVVLTVAASTTMAPGTYDVDVEAFNGTGTGGPYDSKFITVTVPVATTFDYTLTANPTSASIIAGGSTSFTITATLKQGPAETISLSASITPLPAVCLPTPGSPPGSSPCGTVTLTPQSLTPTTSGASFTIALTTTTVLPIGTYTLNITGTPVGASHSFVVFLLTITSPATPDFTISASPTSLTLSSEDSENCHGQGHNMICDDEGQVAITITGLNGFSGTVALSMSSSPQLDTSLSTETITTTTSSTLTINEAAPGTYVLTITGTFGSLVHHATVNVAVRSPEKLKCGGENADCQIESDAPLQNVNFGGHTIHFTMTGDAGTVGVANVTVARSAVPDINRVKVYIDHNQLSSSDVTITNDGSNYHIYFKVTFHSNVDVDIDLSPTTNAILGLDPTIFYAALGGGVAAIILIVAAGLAIRRRNRSRTASTR